MERGFIILPVLTSLSLPVVSHAATVTAPLEISATVVSACDVEAAPITFAPYDGTAQTVPADITVTCNDGLNYQVALDAGVSGDRTLQDANGNQLPYSLAVGGTDVVWGDAGVGDTVPTADPVTGLGTGAAEVFTVDGMVPGGVDLPAGDYTDTVTVTVNF